MQFPGFADDLLPWMKAADGIALASRWGGLPVVLLEAAACGLSTVATEVPGSRGVSVPANTVYLCAPGGPANMAAAMQHILQLSQSERAAIGLRARRPAEARFGLTPTLDRWEALYRDQLTALPNPAHRTHPHTSPQVAAAECSPAE